MVNEERLREALADRYRFERQLGEGGMATVWKARQLSLDRVVAIKILSPHLARKEDYVQRFLREAKIAARLSHANIVQIFDLGVDGCNGNDGWYLDAVSAVLLLVPASILVWVTVTLRTRPVAQERLEAFYRRVRPGGDRLCRRLPV